MSRLHIAVVPVGKVALEEVDAAVSRAVKILRTPLEVRGKLPVPSGAEDLTRRQFRAVDLMAGVRSMVPQLGPGKLVNLEGESGDKPPLKTDGYVFVTDADLFTANSDGVFAALKRARGVSVVSIRRLREAYYRRKADHNKHRARLAKEIARMTARLNGLPECPAPTCVVSSSRMLADIDLKEEKLCRDCTSRLHEGRIRI